MKEKELRVRVAAIIIKNKKVLLVKHCKNNKVYWLLPGGGVEVGEVIGDSLKRELKEELNIYINLYELIFVVESVSNNGRHLIQPTFLIRDFNLRNIKIGEDPRVCGYNFFSVNRLKDIIIYPDIKDELISILLCDKKALGKRYIVKKWKN